MFFLETDFPVQPRQSSASYPNPSARITGGTRSLVSFIFFMYTFQFCSFTWPLMSLDFHTESNNFPSSCLSGDFAFSFSKEMSWSWFLADGCFPLQHFEHHSPASRIPLCLVRAVSGSSYTQWHHFSPAAFKVLSLSLTFSHGWWGTRVLCWKVMGLLGRAGLCGTRGHTLRVLFMSLSSLLPAGMLTVPVPLHSASSVFLIGTVTFLLQAAWCP